MASVEHANAFDNGAIINALDIQSIDIPDKFTLVKQPGGWIATLNADEAKVTINLQSMRKLDYTLHSGDTIEKKKDSIIVLQTAPEEGETTEVIRSLSYPSRRRRRKEEKATAEEE